MVVPIGGMPTCRRHGRELVHLVVLYRGGRRSILSSFGRMLAGQFLTGKQGVQA